jgi:hypothetical protein
MSKVVKQSVRKLDVEGSRAYEFAKPERVNVLEAIASRVNDINRVASE